MPAKSFFWYELMTTDMKAAAAFYADVVGWQATPWGEPSSPPYTIMNAGERGVAGIMHIPDEVRRSGGQPMWLGYIYAEDTDKATNGVEQAGGTVHRPPSDIPGVGRFSVVSDPQGVMFMLLSPIGPDQPPVPAGTPGHIGWHELYTSDWQKAFEFYSGQFGWTKEDAMDMGPMGTYQLFAAGDDLIGGMMNRPAQIPFPFWQFYFNVPAVEAAAQRVKTGGGQILMDPMEVPGGSWIVQCMDPQGAAFALAAPEL
ncbi:VOC family protein [Chelativorans sp. AA-79]|uniref:VOC family protein n=1 Tax=Chelativorans sp. AA-79 TaxID=3028735 RepID=UPI0023F9567A|nr:VOC family protein [Chelativorans sp. AA-79]WEX11293.1 VOC family protein [Chelativorans sp. AA-79]